MRRSRMILGLPAFTLAAMCASASADTAKPLRDAQGAPATGNVMQKRVFRAAPSSTAGVSSSASGVATSTLVASSDTVAILITAQRPLTDKDGCPACGNIQRKSSEPETAKPAEGTRVAP